MESENLKKVKNYRKQLRQELTDQEFETILKMEKYGGSFIQALAVCFQKADWENFKKLKDTFSEYWKQYEEM